MSSLQSEITPESAEGLADSLDALDAGARIRLLADRFPGQIIASTSYGLQASVMLKLLRDHAPEIPIIFIDTGYLFPETYRYAIELEEKLGFKARVYRPEWSPAWQEAVHGKLWEQGEIGLEKYALLNKVEPMSRARADSQAKVWLSGLRRCQSKTRKDRALAEQQAKTIKAYPILDWNDEAVNTFVEDSQLPRHPLATDYATMGDWHSTKKRADANHAEETRFNGEKYECGLHLDSGVQDFQI